MPGAVIDVIKNNFPRNVTTLKGHILLKGNFAHNSFDSKYRSVRIERKNNDNRVRAGKSC